VRSPRTSRRSRSRPGQSQDDQQTWQGFENWIDSDVATVATLDVRNANEHYVLRSAATPGATFVPAWNAWRTNVP
jgi:hypothetical protein